MAVLFVWILIGILVVAGLIFNANRKLSNLEPERRAIRSISLGVIIIVFCTLMGVMNAFNP